MREGRIRSGVQDRGQLLAPKPNPAGFVYLPLFIPRKANFPGVWGHPQARHIKIKD